MFIHRAELLLNPNSHNFLSQKIEREIMPALRSQKGFLNGVTSIDTFWSTAIEDTFWETNADAEFYRQTGYPETLKMLSGLLAGAPSSSIFEVTDSGSRDT